MTFFMYPCHSLQILLIRGTWGGGDQLFMNWRVHTNLCILTFSMSSKIANCKPANPFSNQIQPFIWIWSLLINCILIWTQWILSLSYLIHGPLKIRITIVGCSVLVIGCKLYNSPLFAHSSSMYRSLVEYDCWGFEHD